MRALARAGEWIYLRTLSGVSSYTYTHGTAKTESSTETDSWSDSVTKTVSASLKVNLPFGDIGGGVSVATTTATEQSKTYSSEWSMSTEESLEITYDASYEGKALWQWQFFIGDTYGNSLNTKVQNYALTSGTYEPPRCYPGGSIDDGESDKVSYQSCYDDEHTIPFYIPITGPLVGTWTGGEEMRAPDGSVTHPGITLEIQGMWGALMGRDIIPDTKFDGYFLLGITQPQNDGTTYYVQCGLDSSETPVCSIIRTDGGTRYWYHQFAPHTPTFYVSTTSLVGTWTGGKERNAPDGSVKHTGITLSIQSDGTGTLMGREIIPDTYFDGNFLLGITQPQSDGTTYYVQCGIDSSQTPVCSIIRSDGGTRYWYTFD